MRIQSRNRLFQHDLGNILATGKLKNKKDAPETRRIEFARNLYKIKNKTTRDHYILEYISRLSEHTKPKDKRFEDCKQLITLLKKEAQNHASTTSKVKTALDKTFTAFYVPPQKKSSSSDKYGKYPEAHCKVLDLANHVKKNSRLIEKLFKQCKQNSTKKDPELVGKTEAGKETQSKIHTSSFAYMDNRIADLNASHVQIGNKVNFILSARPKSTEEIRDHLYHAIIGKECNLWFTVNDCKSNRFWTTAHLKNLTLPDNWKIKNVKEAIVLESPLQEETDNEGKTPRLVKTTLIAKKGKTERKIIHYHYDNWLDSKAAPCEKILLKCAEIASKHIEQTGKPVGINCRAGIGRTGVLANTIYGVRHIQEELKKGKALKDISINLAECNYQLRRQRQGIVANEEQFVQVWHAVGAYAKQLQEATGS